MNSSHQLIHLETPCCFNWVTIVFLKATTQGKPSLSVEIGNNCRMTHSQNFPALAKRQVRPHCGTMLCPAPFLCLTEPCSVICSVCPMCPLLPHWQGILYIPGPLNPNASFTKSNRKITLVAGWKTSEYWCVCFLTSLPTLEVIVTPRTEEQFSIILPHHLKPQVLDPRPSLLNQWFYYDNLRLGTQRLNHPDPVAISVPQGGLSSHFDEWPAPFPSAICGS